MTPVGFTPEQLSYLRDQRLGRLATVDEQHAPQVVPVGFFVDERTGDVLIGGIALGSTRKFRNVEATGRAALVVDDLASTIPGTCAESRSEVAPRPSGMSTHRGPG